MTTVKIFGEGDDAVKVAGSILGCKSYNAWGNGGGTVVCEPSQDRFLLKYDLEDGVWRVTHEHNSGLLKTSFFESPVDDGDVYSDVFTVDGVIDRVRFAQVWPISKEEIRERVEFRLQGILDDDEIQAVWVALGEP